MLSLGYHDFKSNWGLVIFNATRFSVYKLLFVHWLCEKSAQSMVVMK